MCGGAASDRYMGARERVVVMEFFLGLKFPAQALLWFQFWRKRGLGGGHCTVPAVDLGWFISPLGTMENAGDKVW